MTFSWMDRTRWVHEVTGERITTWLGSGSTHVGYLLKINDIHTLNCETTMIWLDDRRESRSTLGWE
jgi:hypothetical protein